MSGPSENRWWSYQTITFTRIIMTGCRTSVEGRSYMTYSNGGSQDILPLLKTWSILRMQSWGGLRTHIAQRWWKPIMRISRTRLISSHWSRITHMCVGGWVLPLLCSGAWFRCFLSDSLFTTGHCGFSSLLTVATTNFATEQRRGKWAWDSNFDETITKEQWVHSVSIADWSSWFWDQKKRRRQIS